MVVEWDRVVSDRTMNCGDSRELLTNTYDFPGIAGGPDVTPEFVIAMAQCASPEELPMLVAWTRQTFQQGTPAGLICTTSHEMSPGVEVLTAGCPGVCSPQGFISSASG